MKLQYLIFCLITLMLCSCKEKPAAPIEHAVPGGMEDMVMLTKAEILAANILTDTLRLKNISRQTVLTGIASLNETGITVISSRVKGRLDGVYIRSTGEYISQGAPLYDIYSEELLADQNDYLLSLDHYKNARTQKETARQLMEAARAKLLAWTLTEVQIKELEKNNKPSPVLSFFSSVEGYITELSVRGGEYVEIGTPVAHVAGLSTIWVEAQMYGDEVKSLNAKPNVQVEFEIYPGKLFSGAIVFESPSFEANQKVNIVRLAIENEGNMLKPGMMANICLNGNIKKTLVIPKSALLLEKMTTVWVQTSEGMFEPRMVTTGIENKSEVEILSGLKEGDIVVISGAYLLKSEQTVKQGSNSMSGMDM